jgi:hypothetical protein
MEYDDDELLRNSYFTARRQLVTDIRVSTNGLLARPPRRVVKVTGGLRPFADHEVQICLLGCTAV